MSLKHAILGYLTVQPLSGYDLKKVFDHALGYFWSATHSQIYRTLDRLVRDGEATQEVVIQRDRPNKKLYQPTEAGWDELRRWLAEPHGLPTLRHPLLVQLAFAELLDDDQVVALLEDYGARLAERIGRYRDPAHHQHIYLARTPRERFLWWSTLDNGIATLEAELCWVERTIDGFRALPEGHHHPLEADHDRD